MGYIDWSITVPLQMIEFNLILKAAKAPISPGGFWRLLIGTVLMLAFGYAGESKSMNAWAGFILGLAGWGFILNEIFAGESANASGQCSAAVKQAFNNMRIIVSAGWSIYPAGYYLGSLGASGIGSQALNVTYNIADFVNKIACWLAGLVPRLIPKEPKRMPCSHTEPFRSWLCGTGEVASRWSSLCHRNVFCAVETCAPCTLVHPQHGFLFSDTENQSFSLFLIRHS